MLVAVDGDGGTDGDCAAFPLVGRLSPDAAGPIGSCIRTSRTGV